MKSWIFASALSTLVLLTPAALATAPEPGQVSPALDCYWHLHTRQDQPLQDEAQHLLRESMECALACLFHFHTMELKTPQEQVAHFVNDAEWCASDWTGASLDAPALAEICSANPCIEPVVDINGKESITVGVHHHAFLGGSVFVTLTGDGVRVTYAEGIMVCTLTLSTDLESTGFRCVF